MGKLSDSGDSLSGAILQVHGVERDATSREMHILFSGCVGYISASLSEEGSAKIGVVQFDSAESAFQAAHARKGSSWDPATGPVLLRPVSSRTSDMTRRRMQPLNLSEIRSGSSPRPTTPRSWRDVRAGSSPRTTTPRSWRTESTNVTPRTRPNSPVRQSFGLSFRNSLHVLPTPETAKKALPTQGLRQAKMALKRAAEKKFTKALEDAVANARSVGLPEEDPDLERAISLLNDRLQPVDARWVTSLHTRAAAKLKHAWPSRREETSLTPRQRRAALQDALCAAAEALTLTPQAGISSLQKKTEKQLRSVSSRWISHAWGDLDAAFEAKDLEALCQAAEECSAAESACHAAGAQSLRPEPAMLDKLRSSLRICDGSSSFSLEAKRLHALEEVREALRRRLGEGSKDEQHSTQPFLADALREALRQGCQAGDAEDDCIGRALGFQSRLSERLPQRWGLWSSLLLSHQAVLWEASPSLARVQKALAFSRTAGAPDLELRNASMSEEKFGRHFAVARDLDEALETDLNLVEAAEAAQHVEGDGGWLLVATNLRRARRRLGAHPAPVDPQGLGNFDESAPEASTEVAKHNLVEALRLGAQPLVRAALKHGSSILDPQLVEEGEQFLKQKELLAQLQRCSQRGDAWRLEAALSQAASLGLESEHPAVEHFQGKLHGLRAKEQETQEKLSAIKLQTISFDALKCQKDGKWATMTGCTQISREGRQVIREVARCLKEYPGLAIRVEGHSNDRNPQRAKVVSQARADAVKAALQEAGCTNWMVSHGWGLAHSLRKKMVRILPSVDMERLPTESALTNS
eukprot:s2595_g2.t1